MGRDERVGEDGEDRTGLDVKMSRRWMLDLDLTFAFLFLLRDSVALFVQGSDYDV